MVGGMKEWSRSELPHPASKGLDRMEPAEMVELFHACDLEALDALFAPIFLQKLSALGKRLQKHPPSRLVLAGAGTSGRLAYLLADRHRAALARRGIRLLPWIAGGAKALCLPVEGAEDDSLRAKRDLAERLGEEGFFVGISCGLSAPAVAGGMAAALERGLGIAVFGTNEERLARKDSFPGLPQGFHGVLEEARERGDFFALTPDTGPEVLTGSSRMKGGTATLVCFDALFSSLAEGALEPESLEEKLREGRRLVVESFGSLRGELVRSLDLAGRALRGGGQVLYLGRGEPGLAGVLDASECPPTFGAEFDQVRAYLTEGWGAFGSLDASERIALEASLPLQPREMALRDPSKPLLVLALGGAELPPTLSERLGGEMQDLVEVDTGGLLCSKLFLNALSTGAFVQAGKVYQNRMIDLQLSNSKLFLRAQRIVVDLLGVPDSEALRAIVGAIHGIYPPPVNLLRLPVEAHLKVPARRVVPTAVLLAKGYSLPEARRRLEQEPRIRDLVDAP